MAEEHQHDAREADVAGGDRGEAERGEGSNDSRHEQMDSYICSEGRFLEAAQSPRAPAPNHFGTATAASPAGPSAHPPAQPLQISSIPVRRSLGETIRDPFAWECNCA